MQAVTEENEGNSHSGSMQAAGAAMATAALLAACGGGDAPPAAMLDGRAAVSRPELLEVQGSDTRHALAAPTPDAERFTRVWERVQAYSGAYEMNP